MGENFMDRRQNSPSKDDPQILGKNPEAFNLRSEVIRFLHLFCQSAFGRRTRVGCVLLGIGVRIGVGRVWLRWCNFVFDNSVIGDSALNTDIWGAGRLQRKGPKKKWYHLMAAGAMISGRNWDRNRDLL